MEDSENNKNPSVGNIPNNNISEQNIQNINEHSKNENNINEHSEFQTKQKMENKEPEISETTNESKEKEENIIEENENKINENNINIENNDNNIINKLEPHTLIKIRTSDKKIYKVQVDILLKSKLLVGLVQDYIDFIIEDDEIIELSQVDSKNFDLIIDYLQHYKDKEPKEIPKPFPERTDEEFLRSIMDNDDNDWTYNFITKLKLEEAIHLLNCADYLQIDGLIRILAAKIAYEMCNCDIEEARKKFGIQFDMDEEEIEEYEEFVKYPMD